MKKIFLLAIGLILLGAPGAFAATLTPGPTTGEWVDISNPPATAGTIGTLNDGTIFKVIDQSPTGTGVFEPFLRLGTIGNATTEAGLNTGAKIDGQNPVYGDIGGTWTHALQWSSLGTLTLNGTDYYQLTLDINEPANGPARFLSLDQMKIYSAASGDLTNISQLGTALWDLNLKTAIMPPAAGAAPYVWGSGNVSAVLFDYTLAGSGQGEADIEVFIPKSIFAGVNPNDYFYLYSTFGAVGSQTFTNSPPTGNDYQAEDGYEEWRALQGGVTVPEPSMLLLLGAGLVGIGVVARKRARK